ncbi:MAG: hypothetical protein KC652_18405 [Cyanobacteria bacterium HKST-UBA01]|nr:hypothetical protein [Cyanobacteria bacterium HKST-UBA01]
MNESKLTSHEMAAITRIVSSLHTCDGITRGLQIIYQHPEGWEVRLGERTDSVCFEKVASGNRSAALGRIASETPQIEQ